jgi:hypothetical protein
VVLLSRLLGQRSLEGQIVLERLNGGAKVGVLLGGFYVAVLLIRLLAGMVDVKKVVELFFTRRYLQFKLS